LPELGARTLKQIAALVGLAPNPVIKNIYTQLRARGKYPRSALIACMRKLLVILNAMLHHNTHWTNTCTHLPNLSPFSLPRRGS
jgi:transposase